MATARHQCITVAQKDANQASLEVIALLVNALKGDHEEDQDSALYEALG